MAKGCTRDRDPATLGDPRAVECLLSIVTGRVRRPEGDGAGIVVFAGPLVEVLPLGWNGRTVRIERTPSEIRRLCEEGIIAPAAPWKRAPS